VGLLDIDGQKVNYAQVDGKNYDMATGMPRYRLKKRPRRLGHLVREMHDRMPVIIAPAHYQVWLTASPATAKKLLVPYTRGLTLTPVSQRVNSVRNDDAGLLATAI
jgi:hypothetical protein